MKSIQKSWQSRINNAQGHLIEGEIERACLYYKAHGIADIEKTPEPFIVIKKEGQGVFKGRFTRKKAQPDFKGVLRGGRSIVFEIKSTQADRIGQNVLSETQNEILESYYKLGAVTFVCIAIGQSFFTVPWVKWRDMKQHYGRKYIKADEVEEYKISYYSGIMFLEKIEVLKNRSRQVGYEKIFWTEFGRKEKVEQ